MERSTYDDILVPTDGGEDVDRVVMGTHDEQDQRAMLGSVAQKVVAKSPVPVLTVQIGE